MTFNLWETHLVCSHLDLFQNFRIAILVAYCGEDQGFISDLQPFVARKEAGRVLVNVMDNFCFLFPRSFEQSLFFDPSEGQKPSRSGVTSYDSFCYVFTGCERVNPSIKELGNTYFEKKKKKTLETRYVIYWG